MQITDFVPLPDPGGSTARTVARFSVSFADLKLSGFRLRLRPNGSFVAAAPAAYGQRVANFSPDLFAKINNAAEAAYRRLHALDRNCA